MKAFWMKIGLILALVLALVAIGSAATDEEILQFSKSLISTNVPGLNATILSPDTLIMAGEYNYFLNTTLGKDTLTMTKRLDNGITAIGDDRMGQYLANMAGFAASIFKQYPNRFEKLDLKLYDPTNALIAHAILAASITAGERSLTPPQIPKTFFPNVEIT